MGKKKKDYDAKEPGQQFEEIEATQRKLGREVIHNIEKSEQADKEELKQSADEALEAFRKKKLQGE
jgi:hypothetical protein